MEKEMIALLKFKSGDGMFEKFMGWMQSDEGMGVRKSVGFYGIITKGWGTERPITFQNYKKGQNYGTRNTRIYKI